MSGKLTITTQITWQQDSTDADTIRSPITVTKEITGLVDFVERARDVANSSTITLLDLVDLAEIASFTFLGLYALTGELLVELTAHEGDAAENRSVHKLSAGGPVLALGSNYSTDREAGDDGFAGTATVLNKIRVKNSSGATAKVVLLMAR